jgi:hypothetical protein
MFDKAIYKDFRHVLENEILYLLFFFGQVAYRYCIYFIH